MKPVYIFLLCYFAVLSGCSQDREEKSDEHIWQNQTDALKDAQELQRKVNKDSERKQKQMDELEK